MAAEPTPKDPWPQCSRCNLHHSPAVLCPAFAAKVTEEREREIEEKSTASEAAWLLRHPRKPRS